MKNMMPDIIGNTKLKNHICRNIMEASLPHALIIEGADGTGKHSLAYMAAAALACEKKHDTNLPLPCGVCPACVKILEKKSPDIILIGSEEKASIGVESIRFLKEDVHIGPNDTDNKIYIIEDADKMTAQAQNALLLTLEEPPEYIQFFLLCNNANSLLETIRSRAPIFRTEPISTDDIDLYISKKDNRAAQMKLTAPDNYKKLLMAAKNGIGSALELLDPKIFAPVLENMSLAEEFIQAATGRCPKKNVFPLLNRFSPKRDILKSQLSLALDAVRDLIALKENDSAPLRFYCDRELAIELCDRTTLSSLFNINLSISKAIEENTRNANVRLMMTKLFCSVNLI